MRTARSLRILLLASLVLASLVSAGATVRFGGPVIGVGVGYWSGPYWGGCGYCGVPVWGGWYGYPYWGPFYSPGYFGAAPDKGEVKLQTSYKNAEVYVDDAYAGTADKLKSFWLAPGVYRVEVRPSGTTPISKRIYVLTGKTLKLKFD